MCLTLNEMPEIRYFAPEALNRPTLGPVEHQHVCYHLAKMVEAKLKAHAAENEDFQVTSVPLFMRRRLADMSVWVVRLRPRAGQKAPCSSLTEAWISSHRSSTSSPIKLCVTTSFLWRMALIISQCNTLETIGLALIPGDRSHSFRNEQGQIEEIDAVLSDDDKVWCEIKHMHMKDALDNLVDSFKQFNAEHGGPSGCVYTLALQRRLNMVVQFKHQRPQRHAS